MNALAALQEKFHLQVQQCLHNALSLLLRALSVMDRDRLLILKIVFVELDFGKNCAPKPLDFFVLRLKINVVNCLHALLLTDLPPTPKAVHVVLASVQNAEKALTGMHVR